LDTGVNCTLGAGQIKDSGALTHTAAAALLLRTTVGRDGTSHFAVVKPDHPDYEASFADVSLTSVGVYVNYQRILNRQPTRKSVAETVALVVEDDADQLALATRCLTDAGYTVQSADRAQALYHRLQRSAPDAVFLDVDLPDGNGFEVLAQLRRKREYAWLPIIMCTVHSEPEDIARGLSLGADGYITKPYGRNTLEYALRYVMNQEVRQRS
jgi:CheY-like chemotaxis protein